MNAPAGPPIAPVEGLHRHLRPNADFSRHDGVTRPVLICTTDPLAAALLGAAAEFAGEDPRFPQPDESARAALLRLRPALVLMDCDYPEACDDTFVGPALMLGIRIVLLRSPRSRTDPSAIAASRGLDVLDLPASQDALADLLRRASA